MKRSAGPSYTLKITLLFALAPLIAGQDGDGCGLFDSSAFEQTDNKTNIPAVGCSCDEVAADTWHWGSHMYAHKTQEYLDRTGRTQEDDSVTIWLGEPRPDCLIYYDVKISSDDPIYPSEFSGYMDIYYDDHTYTRVKLDPIPLEFKSVDNKNLIASFRADKFEQCFDPAAGEILQPFYHSYFNAVVERYSPAFDQDVRVVGEGAFTSFQSWKHDCDCGPGLMTMTNESSRSVEFVFERDSGGVWSELLLPGDSARFRLDTGYYTMKSTIYENGVAGAAFRGPVRFYLSCEQQCEWEITDPDVLYSTGDCVLLR